MARLTRRHALTAGTSSAVAVVAGMLATGPAVSSTAADAELIAIGREAAALIKKRKPLEARWWALPVPNRLAPHAFHPDIEVVARLLDPIDARLVELNERAMLLRAESREAMAAKALLIHHEMRLFHTHDGTVSLDDFCPHEHVVWSLLDDLARGVV